MSKMVAEQRALRNGIDTFLSSSGWLSLNFSEGWGDNFDIEKPLVNVLVSDYGKESLELGRQASTHQLFNRVIQVDIFMETEDRVKAICEDVMEYLDSISLPIKDLLTTSGIGYLSFPNSESIYSDFLPPSFNNPEILRWRGVVRGDFEAYYPNGGNPI